MVKKNLQILGVEETKEGRPLKTANGRSYGRIKTNEGWMSCFDMEEVGKAKEFIDKETCLEVVESKSNEGTPQERVFRNIKKCYGVTEEDAEVVKSGEGIEKAKVTSMSGNTSSNKNATMYTSYAKDIFCARYALSTKEIVNCEAMMNQCIILVKQAKEAFE